MDNFEKSIEKLIVFDHSKLREYDGPRRNHHVFVQATAVQQELAAQLGPRREMEDILETTCEALNDASMNAELTGIGVKLSGTENYVTIPETFKSTITGEIGINIEVEYDDNGGADVIPLRSLNKEAMQVAIDGEFAGFSYNVTPFVESAENLSDDDDEKHYFAGEIVYQVKIDHIRTSLGNLSVYATGVVGESELSYIDEEKAAFGRSAYATLNTLYNHPNSHVRDALGELDTIFEEDDFNYSEVFQQIAELTKIILNESGEQANEQIFTALLDYLKTNLEIDDCVQATATAIYVKNDNNEKFKNTVKANHMEELPLGHVEVIYMPAISHKGGQKPTKEVYLAVENVRKDENNENDAVLYIPVASLIDLVPIVD